MKLYQQLTQDYAKQIDEIKRLRQELADRQTQIAEALIEAPDPSHPAYWKIAHASQEAGQINSTLLDLERDLDYEIQKEYKQVPFAKPREQGMRRFYQGAGLAN